MKTTNKQASEEKVFLPLGFKNDSLPLCVVDDFTYSMRSFVVCTYGFMVGVFDYTTGGKICDMDITKYKPLTLIEYIVSMKKIAHDVLDVNTHWKETLEKLPILNA